MEVLYRYCAGLDVQKVTVYAVNEGPQPLLMILIEIKGTATEQRGQ